MNLKEIEHLIEIIDKSDIDEATIEEGDFKITLKRSASQPLAQPVAVPAPVAAAAPAPQPQAPQPASEPQTTEADADLIEIRSPIVGTFYRAPSPDSDPFINVNDRIEKGDVLCIVEAMKLMNEIEAEVSGSIVEIAVENGQPVEYDQVLFRLKP
ncbi:acetyl-CoA carboxylase biotin carboxyl carrier protein [Prosthecochloris sp. N3]|uniref:Biotin carboxyl carrier protein of acetyl-CoA carboxylase n=1 Tax=Prosthecochloris ethylica TaxID=2743976 RepID=A0ABR9XQP4_9CHLB|nr:MULTISPECIES: acetyl-CoA carboxylase biotin carboxyl carrier protein [Prosthecochloris]MBF0586437.1 acetyl-CoA carboxylase biotin carboxyl carrier protein [Prosthecochloris ethylica]MBF0636345.1 acetyl-CoA carboxylase biotin carboxyl carrier protein [Prosthecochloris ethylica]NUK47519.1 acetyl-CoA carboxylase biotin carboxyl carrier protein [Prosthecochloris ethylica]RNA64224.1 acetyl-CoA carboxylase biotin carboxyl carrier protein [Prosthecochloris sp. ZM_2]